MAPPTVFSLAVVTALAPLVLAGGIVTDPKFFASQKFDYIIVGGGTAGLAVASRLSENRQNLVGVIEAGQHFPDDPLIYTPALFGRTQGQAQYDWLLETVPQPGVNNRIMDQPRGKILGGSSALNYMAFDRASSTEYDALTQFGGSDWSWSGLLPYMKKAETFHGAQVTTPWNDPSAVDTTYEGTTGPVQVSMNTWYSDITGPYLKSANNVNIPSNITPDDGTPEGVYNCRMSVNRTSGRRSYAANTYHTAAAPRPNYFVLLQAEVTKINFAGQWSKRDNVTSTTDAASATTDTTSADPTSTDAAGVANVTSADAASANASALKKAPARATGVTFVYGGKSYTASVNEEVIVSAGSLKTPQLLELSGIGDKRRLQRLGIPVVSDLPGVGENLQDHIFIPNSFALKPGFTTFDILNNDPVYAAQANATYYQDGSGIFGATHSAFAFFDLQTFLPQSTITTLLQNAVRDSSRSNPNPLEAATFDQMEEFIQDGVTAQLEIIMYPGHFSPSPAVPGTSYISILMALQHPWSKGSVHINSTDPSKPPVIDPGYFSNSFDLKVMVEACKLARKIAQTKPLSDAIVSFQDPPASVTTDADFEAYIKGAVESVYHPIGTASLGPQNLSGVVNSRLVVYGTSNLRVVDASIVPLHMSTHLQQTVYSIGEKAADMIEQDCGN
ncbi:hypothetical protein FRB99_007275 [Tulasnella sp. 403]|nr:hypothetical protein FRB99_007275 [Tulasnella sp. 403]